jgi:hypothetical protein
MLITIHNDKRDNKAANTVHSRRNVANLWSSKGMGTT